MGSILRGLCAAGIFCVGWPGGAKAQGPGDTLVVFAASDLAVVLPELGARYQGLTGAVVVPVFGSSGSLAFQIERGAPADLFLSADLAFVERLAAQGVADPATVRRYAVGELVLAWPAGSSRPPRRLADLMDPRVRRVAIANPDHAPYGMAAQEALRRSGLWEQLHSKLVLGENVRQAAQYLQTGAVEAALISRSLASVPGIAWVPLDTVLHLPLDQGAAVMTGSARREQAAAFLAFVTGPEGAAILGRHGFRPPR